MADRYRIGSGAWDDEDKWATTSGGAGPASIPTSEDNVFFDDNTPNDAAHTVTTANALDFTLKDKKFEITVSSVINVYGDFECNDSEFEGTANGSRFVMIGGTPSNSTPLTKMFTCNSDLFNIRLFASGSAGGGFPDVTLGADFTHNRRSTAAHEPPLVLGAGCAFTHNDFAFNIETIGPYTIRGAWSGTNAFGEFNFNLLDGTPTAVNQIFAIEDEIEITAGGSIEGVHEGYRLLVTNRIGGVQYEADRGKIILGSAVSFESTNFFFIEGEEDALTDYWDLTAGNVGDCGGNVGIDFPAGEDCFYHTDESADYEDSSKWYTETDGGGVLQRIPLPQDRAIFDENSFDADNLTVTYRSLVHLGHQDWSDVNRPCRSARTPTLRVYGDCILTPHLNTWAIGNSSFYSFRTGVTQVLDLQGVFAPGSNTTQIGDWELGSPINGFNWYFLKGTLTTNNHNIKVTVTFQSTGDLERTLNLGTSTIELIQTGAGNNGGDLIITGSNFTVNGENATIQVHKDREGDALWEISGGASVYGKLDIILDNPADGAPKVAILTGGSTFKKLETNRAANLIFQSGSTTTFEEWDVASGLIIESSTPGDEHFLELDGGGKVKIKKANITDSHASPTATWYATGTDGGNNDGWIFGTDEALFLGIPF